MRHKCPRCQKLEAGLRAALPRNWVVWGHIPVMCSCLTARECFHAWKENTKKSVFRDFQHAVNDQKPSLSSSIPSPTQQGSTYVHRWEDFHPK